MDRSRLFVRPEYGQHFEKRLEARAGARHDSIDRPAGAFAIPGQSQDECVYSRRFRVASREERLDRVGGGLDVA